MFARNEHSLNLLDFFRMRGRSADYCLSPEGGEVLRASFPIDDREKLEEFKADIAALQDYLASGGTPGFSFPGIDSVLKRAGREGTSLEAEELFAFGLWAKSFDALVSTLTRALYEDGGAAGRGAGSSKPGSKAKEIAAMGEEAEAFETFWAERERLGGYEAAALAEVWADFRLRCLLSAAPKLNDVSKIIFSVLTQEGELRDLPPIKRAREALARANKELAAIADSYRGDPELKSALQSTEPTQRDGRTVLAVRANFRGRVRGIVHEVSASGQTVFIEPEALVEKNNDLVQLEARLRAEIFKVLKETTESLRPSIPAMEKSRAVLALLDQFFARALQNRREELWLPEASSAGYTLWRARHPLLGTRAVPIDVDLPQEARILIVTGPNTGGKTVTLKTIGLFALMHQFGLGLPVAQGTKLPVFDAVLADIGDEQSIDQSLSTFSGHMKVIAEITRLAGPKSLVLLDELGAGTDPEEGCAIAMGLLDFFIAKGSLTIATTHHGILKNYGYTRPGCLNASMEFDATRLAPTYRIAIGIPGESRALEIAAQTGLGADIVAAAGRYLSEERKDIGELIRGLSEKHRELEGLEREQKKRLKAAAEDQRKADLAALRLRQRELELRRHGLGELRTLLFESRNKLENLVRELRESGADAGKTKEVKLFLAELSESVEQQYGVLQREENETRAGARAEKSGGGPLRALAEGSEALYGPYKKRARLLRKDQSGKWLIEIGSLRLSVEEGDLWPLEEGPPPLKPAYDIELAPVSGENAGARASFELDLRGFRLAEALAAVEKQIDGAALQGLGLFSIIHGTGEGVLGKGIQQYLKTNPAVEDYHFARPEEGGYGKTIVRLKA